MLACPCHCVRPRNSTILLLRLATHPNLVLRSSKRLDGLIHLTYLFGYAVLPFVEVFTLKLHSYVHWLYIFHLRLFGLEHTWLQPCCVYCGISRRHIGGRAHCASALGTVVWSGSNWVDWICVQACGFSLLQLRSLDRCLQIFIVTRVKEGHAIDRRILSIIYPTWTLCILYCVYVVVHSFSLISDKSQISSGLYYK